MTKTNSGNNELGERRRRVSGKRNGERSKSSEWREEQPKSEGKDKLWERVRPKSGGGRDQKAKTKNNSGRSKTGRIEQHGSTERLSYMFIFLCTVYYLAVVPTPTSRYTRESMRVITRYTPEFVTLHVICTVSTKFPRCTEVTVANL